MWVLVVASNLTIDHPFCLATMSLWERHTFNFNSKRPVPITTSTVITQFILKASDAFAHVLLPVLASCRFLPLVATFHSGLATMS